jgi:hypothetical protein
MTRLRSAYTIVANTAILLVVVDVGAYLAMTTYDRVVAPMRRPDLSEAARRNYAHMRPAEVAELLRAFGAQRFRYAPVMGFLEDETTSRFLNIDEHGIRQNQGSRRPITTLQDAVWLLGGSTTFGEGVADHETIPAQLEQLLGKRVVNLGVRNYSAAKENLLLNHYLRIGYRPTRAIFLDGINETCQRDFYEEEMDILVAKAQKGSTLDVGQPVTYAYARVRRKLKRMVGQPVDDSDRETLTCESDGKRNPLRTIHERTLAERAALCRLYGIECQTVVQPFAGMHGQRNGFDTTFFEGIGRELRARFEHLEPSWRASGAIFVTDALDRLDRHAFVDDVHYSAEASRLIAEAIAGRLGLAGSAPPAP